MAASPASGTTHRTGAVAISSTARQQPSQGAHRLSTSWAATIGATMINQAPTRIPRVTLRWGSFIVLSIMPPSG